MGISFRHIVSPYFLSWVCAICLVVLGVFVFGGMDEFADQSTSATLSQFVFYVGIAAPIIGVLCAAIFGLPGALICWWLTKQQKSEWYVYAFGAAIYALLTTLFFGELVGAAGSKSMTESIYLITVPSGSLGGLLYWLIVRPQRA